jgi:hypothetical protein
MSAAGCAQALCRYEQPGPGSGAATTSRCMQALRSRHDAMWVRQMQQALRPHTLKRRRGSMYEASGFFAVTSRQRCRRPRSVRSAWKPTPLGGHGRGAAAVYRTSIYIYITTTSWTPARPKKLLLERECARSYVRKRTPAPRACTPGGSMRQTPCNMQQTTCDRHHATCSRQHATDTMQHATDNMQQTPCNLQQTTCDRQRATCNMRQTTGGRQQTACNKQHAECDRQHATWVRRS